MKKYIYISFLGFLGFFCLDLQAQNRKALDSLFLMLKTAKDTTKVNVLNELSITYRYSLPDSSVYYGELALAEAQRMRFSRGTALANMRIGAAHYYKSNYATSIEYYQLALDLFRSIDDKKNVSSALTNIGSTYSIQGDYAKATEYYVEAEKEAKKANDIKGLAYANNAIGSVYRVQGRRKEALEHFEKSKELYAQLGDKGGLALSMQSMSNIYEQEKDFDKALKYLLEAIKLREEVGDKNGYGFGYNRLGTIYFKLKNYPLAQLYAQKALKIFEEAQSKNGRAAALITLADIYHATSRFSESTSAGIAAYKISEDIKSKEGKKQSAFTVAMAYAKLNDYENAYEYYRKFNAAKDSMQSEENLKKLGALQTLFESEKKQATIDLLKKNKFLQDEEYTLQTRFLYATVAFIFFAILAVFALWRSIYLKQKNNTLLGKQKQEITLKNTELELQKEEMQQQSDALNEKNEEIAKKNESITASINYARRIQQSILPFQEDIKRYFPDTFILFKPRDIVSGDCYWFYDIYGEHKKFILAAIDCTGHGVPGAFMTMIADSLLTDLVIDKGLEDVDKILAEMHKGIQTTLKQDKTANQDGMDISLCLIDTEKRTIDYAGAKHPLYYFDNDGNFHEVKGDRHSMGGEQMASNVSFTKHTLSWDDITVFYTFSDGYEDQFGGANNKKFMSKRMKQLFIDIHDKPATEQQKILDETIEKWKNDGRQKQTDDILVIGMKI